MYAIMNMTDGKYASDCAAYQTTTLTFKNTYTHVILWRNGEKKLVSLDENHCLEVENAAGEAVYVIPYAVKTARVKKVRCAVFLLRIYAFLCKIRYWRGVIL